MSEVQRVRQQIENEAQVLRLLANGFRNTASHETITAAMERLGGYHEKLTELIGEEQAAEIVLTVLGKDDEKLISLEVTIPRSLQEVITVLKDHGCRLEVVEETRTIAHFAEGTIKQPSPYGDGFEDITFPDDCSILLRKADNALLLELEQ